MSNQEKKVIVVAGGTGGMGRYIVDAIKKTGKPLVVFSRKESPVLAEQGINVTVVDYKNKECLLNALRGVHTVISTMESDDDLDGVKNQLLLLDACKEAGVKRYAPSVWYGRHSKATLCVLHQKLRQPVIEAVEKSGIEYTIFMVGHLLDYFAAPQKSTKYLPTFPIIVDINQCKAEFVGTGDEPFCVTAVDDVGQFVAAALDLEKWEPEMGVVGSRTCWNEVIRLGEKVRGRKFDVTKLTPEESLAKRVPNPSSCRINQLYEWLISYSIGEIDYKPYLNEKFPHLKATTLEEFLNKWWSGKQDQVF